MKQKLTPMQCAGKKLKRLISENYSSQEEFSFAVGYELRTISRYVNQGINKVDTLQFFAEHFNVSISEFFDDDG